jgi:hypothetical protein
MIKFPASSNAAAIAAFLFVGFDVIGRPESLNSFVESGLSAASVVDCVAARIDVMPQLTAISRTATTNEGEAALRKP